MIDIIRTLGDPCLTIPTKPIIEFDDSLYELERELFKVMDESGGVGLAANQIGISKNIFVYDDRRGNAGCVANATLLSPDTHTIQMDEGCLSVPGHFHLTPRYKHIKLLGQDLDGSTISIEAEGLLAQIFQHETDHLKGKLFISYLPSSVQMGIVLGRQVMH